MKAIQESMDNVVLTDRDFHLMKYLNEHKYMTPEQIYGMFWPEASIRSGAGRQRLEKLELSGYVKKIPGKGKIPILFFVTNKGIEALKGKGWDYGFKEVKELDENVVEHNLKLFNIRKEFEQMAEVDWKTERVFRSQETTRNWFPDAVFRYRGHLFSVEHENTFRNKQIYAQKFRWYDEAPEFTAVFYVLNWPFVKSWLMDFECALSKIGFLLYDDLIKSGRQALIENKMSKMAVGVLFDA